MIGVLFWWWCDIVLVWGGMKLVNMQSNTFLQSKFYTSPSALSTGDVYAVLGIRYIEDFVAP